jgi:eukaryotic-like serine/threonine-protein kinase
MLTTNDIVQNRYRIVRQLGQGGMGTVYEAVDQRLDATVALKESHFTDEQFGKQFEREARLLAKLRHSAITRVIDHFRDDDGQFLVMDFVAGEDLAAKLERNGRGLPVAEVLNWADQLLDALDYLHSQEPPVIHRDIKPQNLKLTNRNQIILLDFGLAKGFAGQLSRVTTSGSIFGYTPNYAPLEQIQGTGTDPRSDIYSIAATLYHLLTGVVPPDVLTRLTATSDGQPDPLHAAHELRREIGTEVATILNRAMAIGRSQRFPHAVEMREALRTARAQPVAEPVQLPTTSDDSSPARIASTVMASRATTEKDSFEERPALKSTIAAPVAEPIAHHREPSPTQFEEPVGKIDRFRPTRMIAIFLLLAIVLMVIVFFLGAILSTR